MKDLYLKVETKETLNDIINPLLREGEVFNNYFQNDQFIVDYIGKIPKIIDEETGEVTEWTVQDRFNVRLIDESVSLFNQFESVSPEIPYRMFS